MEQQTGALSGDAVYSDAVAKVEPYGIEPIPDSERHGRPRDQFTVYFAINLALATMVTGFFPVAAGLSIAQAVSSIVVGTAAGAIILGIMSTMGSRLGVTQPVLARGPMGVLGQIPLMAYAGVFGGMGWATINLVFGAEALEDTVHLPFWIGAVALAVGQGAVAVFGYNMVHLLNRICTFVIGAVFVVLTVMALGKADFSFAANPDAPAYIGGWGGWITSAGVFLALLIGFSPYSADYSRYLPVRTSPTKVACFTGLGNFLVVAWLACLGALLASFAGADTEIQAVRHLGGGFAFTALLLLGLSTVALNGFNMYGSSMSLLGLGVPMRRVTAVVTLTVLTLAIGLWLKNDLFGIFYDFLVLAGYVLAPYVVVTLLDYYVGGRSKIDRVGELFDESRRLEFGFTAWVVGVAASVPFWMWKHYVGPVASAHPAWGDLSYYVGGAVTAVVWVALWRAPALARLLTVRSSTPVSQPMLAAERERGTVA